MKKKVLSILAAALFVLNAASVQAANMGADRHVARGVKCESCHGPDAKNPTYPDENTCLQCHNRDEVAQRSKELDPNPHKAPHNGDCTLCHMQHEPEVNYCSQCHEFNWTMRTH